MNPSTYEPEPPLLPPQLPLAHHPSKSCERHPEEHFTGFCPSCLCERLSVLDNSSSSSSSVRKPTTTSAAAAALKAIFKPPTSGSGTGGGNTSNRNRPISFFPELRRTQSFSASKNEGLSGVFEPQRKSCDVRGRSTLSTLFNQDDGRKKEPSRTSTSGISCGFEIEIETRKSCSSVQGPVLESKEEEEEDNVVVEEEDGVRVSGETNVGYVIEQRVGEIVEEIEEGEEEPQRVQEEDFDLKPMKDHIDLDSQTKKRDLKEIAGSFWSAASVFSKKLQKWRQKQKTKKRRNGSGSATLPVEKPIGRQFRETQSEIADYGFGRRSCDTDPRFSLDVGRISLDAARMSFDDPRYSFDEPRASWDGHLIGRTNFSRMPTMLSVVEDAPVHVMRSDTQIPVEEPMNSINDDEPGTVPGGSSQTRDYYLDSSSKRRRSLDRSSSVRKTAAAVVADIDELKSVSISKVSPATTTEYTHGPKLVVPDRDLRDSNSNSLRDDCSEIFEIGLGDNASVVGNVESKGSKKSRRWSKAWNIWGLINRRGGSKEEDDRFSRVNGVDRSFSESWPELRGDRIGEARVGFNPKMVRSNSSVSWRNSQGFSGGNFSSMRKSNVETSEFERKKRDEFVLDRNRSTNGDNSMLRFYMTPVNNSRRTEGTKSRYSQAHSIARSVLRLY